MGPMLTTRIAVGLLLAALIGAPALGETLYGVDGAEGNSAANLYILDPANGSVLSTVGPIGFPITGLAFDRRTNTLYGSVGGNGANPRSLVTIDRTTGAGTLVGSLGVNTPMADITFSPSGTLFGWSGFTGTRGLYTVDPATGAATFVGPNTGRGSFVDGNGLASDAAGDLFGAASDFNVSRTVQR